MGLDPNTDAFIILLFICCKAVSQEKEAVIMTEADIPWALLAPFIVLYFILAVSALVSCMKQEKTNGPKWMWILIIFGISFVGPVSYFIIGKKTYERRRV